jgi:RNA polymerase sigma-70 factor (family 1)
LLNEKIDIVQLQRHVALQRSEVAYKELFMFFYKPLTRFATGFIKSAEAAEEIYCDVFTKLWTLGESLNNIGNLKIYLYTSVKNASLNYLARYHKVKVVDISDADVELYTTVTTPENELLQNELIRNAAVVIKSLPPQCRLVYKLIREEGFSYKETATLLDISVNTVEAHMKTALKKLRNGLKAYLRPDAN